jgi:hypothetical protein
VANQRTVTRDAVYLEWQFVQESSGVLGLGSLVAPRERLLRAPFTLIALRAVIRFQLFRW